MLHIGVVVFGLSALVNFAAGSYFPAIICVIFCIGCVATLKEKSENK